MSGGFNCTLFHDCYDEHSYNHLYGQPNYIVHKNEMDLKMREGETPTFTIPIGVYVPGNDGDNVYYNEGQTPETSTVGDVGDKALNLYDMKSWTCSSVEYTYPPTFTWVQDEEFSPREDGNTVFPVSYKYYLGKHYEIKFLNNRYEEVFTDTVDACSPLNYAITTDLSKILKKGIYRYQIDLINENGSRIRMADASDSGLLVN